MLIEFIGIFDLCGDDVTKHQDQQISIVRVH